MDYGFYTKDIKNGKKTKSNKSAIRGILRHEFGENYDNFYNSLITKRRKEIKTKWCIVGYEGVKRKPITNRTYA